jgi:hypothetical protein
MYTCFKPFVEVSSRRSVEQTPLLVAVWAADVIALQHGPLQVTMSQ